MAFDVPFTLARTVVLTILGGRWSNHRERCIVAMEDRYDVVIIGAGPGGLVAASELAEHGVGVAIFDRAGDIGPKVCAGALPSQIHEFGIPADIIDKEFSSITAHAAGQSYQLSMPAPFLYTADRGRFGQYLLRRATANGAQVCPDTRITEITSDYVVANGRKVSYRYLIGADGSHSVTRKYLGLPVRKLGSTLQYVVPREHGSFELFFDAREFGSGIAWIVPHNGCTMIGLGRDLGEARGKSLREICRRWCRQQGIDLTGGREEAWPINYDYCGWHFGNVFLVGDAGGFASGLTGEGIYAAMVSGREAARRIINPASGATDLDRILRKKRSHDRAVSVMQASLSVLGTCHRILLYLTRYGWVTKRYVDYLF